MQILSCGIWAQTRVFELAASNHSQRLPMTTIGMGDWSISELLLYSRTSYGIHLACGQISSKTGDSRLHIRPQAEEASSRIKA